MAAGDRTNRIVERVRLKLDIIDSTKISDNAIRWAIDDVQGELAEKTLCLEGSASLSIVASTAAYNEPTGFYRMKLIALSSGLLTCPVEIDSSQFDALNQTSNTTTTRREIFYKRWNGQIVFYPTPGANATYTVYYYKIPTTTVSTIIDPETPAVFDKAIEYYALSEIAPMAGKLNDTPMYLRLYKDELDDQILSWKRKQTVPFYVESNMF